MRFMPTVFSELNKFQFATAQPSPLAHSDFRPVGARTPSGPDFFVNSIDLEKLFRLPSKLGNPNLYRLDRVSNMYYQMMPDGLNRTRGTSPGT